MSRIPFIEARFYDPDESRLAIEDRFTRHLRKLRNPNLTSEAPLTEDESAPLMRRVFNVDPNDPLTDGDYKRIAYRTAHLLLRREASSDLTHLKRDARDQLKVLSEGAQLIEIRSEHHADELAAQLHAELPWMAPATTEVWLAMRRSVREGLPGLRLPPLLLDGPPGIGKSHWARRLGQLIGTPVTVVEATGEQASFGLVGSQRGWAGACPGRLIRTVLQSVVANPIIVVDEVEKAGQAKSTNGHTFGLAEALLPLLEPMAARRWSCPYYQVRFDMSWVGWVLTSNDLRRLPEPLLSRCSVIRLEALSVQDLAIFAEQTGRARGLSDASLSSITGALEIVAPGASTRPSLRTVLRMLDRATDLENKPTVM